MQEKQLEPIQMTEDDAIEYLASIVVGMFLDKKRELQSRKHNQTSSDILPSINKGAG